jgi:hypothetical protein
MALSPAQVIGALTYGACLYDGPAAFVGTWTGTLYQTFSNCGYSNDDGSASLSSSDTFALSGSGLADTTSANCTFNLTVSDNVATIESGSTCSATEENGTINAFYITSGSFTLSDDGTTLTETATGLEEVIVDGEESDSCTETVSETETLQAP